MKSSRGWCGAEELRRNIINSKNSSGDWRAATFCLVRNLKGQQAIKWVCEFHEKEPSIEESFQGLPDDFFQPQIYSRLAARAKPLATGR